MLTDGCLLAYAAGELRLAGDLEQELWVPCGEGIFPTQFHSPLLSLTLWSTYPSFPD